MKKIWINGTFDILHIGHIRLIQHAASFGNLRIGVDTDERVKEKKGYDRPFNKLENRIEFLLSIKGVDSVVTFSTDDELVNKIKEWEPDVMVIGNDYEYDKIIGVEYIPKVEFFNKIPGFSTSNILKNKK